MITAADDIIILKQCTLQQQNFSLYVLPKALWTILIFLNLQIYKMLLPQVISNGSEESEELVLKLASGIWILDCFLVNASISVFYIVSRLHMSYCYKFFLDTRYVIISIENSCCLKTSTLSIIMAEFVSWEKNFDLSLPPNTCKIAHSVKC